MVESEKVNVMKVNDNGILKDAKEISYDQLKVGDTIYWYGALLDIVEVWHETRENKRLHTKQKCTYFETKEHNGESIAILGKFYCRGTYGGIDELHVCKVV